MTDPNSAPPSVYPFGQAVRLWFTFKDENNTLADPTDFTVFVDPEGSTTQPYAKSACTRESLGIFSLIVVANIAGAWFYRVESTGAIETGGQKYFEVLTPRPVAP